MAWLCQIADRSSVSAGDSRLLEGLHGGRGYGAIVCACVCVCVRRECGGVAASPMAHMFSIYHVCQMEGYARESMRRVSRWS